MKGITNKQVVARHSDLAVPLTLVLSALLHAGESLLPGTVLAKMANGKYRAYAEGEVSTAFNAANANFAVDPAGPLAKYFRVGDALESVAGVALGTILSFNPITGVGTLTANSAAALAVGQRVRVTEASASLGSGKGRLLVDLVEVGEVDAVVSGYVEGYMLKTSYTTDAAIAKMGVAYTSPQGDEFKMKL